MRRISPLRGLLLLCLAGVLLAAPVPSADAGRDPRLAQRLYADPGVPAAQRGGAYARLGAVPQATWLTDASPVATVARSVADYLARARAAQATPELVLYAIPGRDCDSYSSGGWPEAATYRRWVAQIASALRGARAIVILEPDALPLATTCGGSARVALLRWATKRLARSGAWVYLDAGHGGWQPASTMAQRLRAAGVRWARGFSLNVSNFRPTAQERRYGNAILTALRARRIRHKHFVVDTSRNGVSPRSSEWCNPTWARLGSRPRMGHTGKAFDGRLWVKHPGESDGLCNGGPAPGRWSDTLADRLLGRGGGRVA